MQMMLQVTLAFVGCLTLIWIVEAQYERAIRYCFQSTFAATVTVPMLAQKVRQIGVAPRSAARLVEKEL